MPCTTGIHSNDGGVIAAAPGQQQQQDQSPQTQINTNSMYPQDNNAAQIGNTNALTSYQQPIQGVAPAGSRGGDANKGGGPVGRRPRLSMSLNGRMSIGGLGGLNGLASITSETTFGRAMSGLSALSIDWENMEDFDVNLDHSAGINNDIINGRQQQGRSDSNPAGGESGRQVQGDGQDDAGGYGQQQLQADNMRRGPMVSRRSSLRKNLPVNPNGNMFNVSFNM